MQFKKRYLALLLLITQFSFGQEGVAVYSDYLSDNYYLIHPSMAGAATCSKLRLTHRTQWSESQRSPQLQTLSFNTRLGERSGGGIIGLNDRNGYHSQLGVKITYAHHIRFSRADYNLNMLSFGLSGAMIQSKLDETQFGLGYDPATSGGLVQKDFYYNFDFGMSYHYLEFFSHFTVKNAVASRRELYTEHESDNLRKYLVSAGYVFGGSKSFQLEPSLMYQFVEDTREHSLDANLKVYKRFENGRLWGALSYRRVFNGTQYAHAGEAKEQRLQYVTPIVGFNYKALMIAYTYSHLLGEVNYGTGGFHQITVGLNLFCGKENWDCNCPAVN